MSHKKFQHFIKCFDVFIKAKTNIKKKKGKIKQKIKGKTYLAPRAKPAHPAQPAHRGSGVFFPLPRTQAARWNATAPAGATRRRRAPSRPPRALFSRPGDVSQPPRSIPPSTSSLLSSLARFIAARGTRRSAVEHTRGPRRREAPRTCPRSRPSWSSLN